MDRPDCLSDQGAVGYSLEARHYTMCNAGYPDPNCQKQDYSEGNPAKCSHGFKNLHNRF